MAVATLAKPNLAKLSLAKFGQTKSDQDNFGETGLCTCCAPSCGIPARPGPPSGPPPPLRTQILVLRVVLGVLSAPSPDPLRRTSPPPDHPDPNRPNVALFFPPPPLMAGTLKMTSVGWTVTAARCPRNLRREREKREIFGPPFNPPPLNANGQNKRKRPSGQKKKQTGKMKNGFRDKHLDTNNIRFYSNFLIKKMF